MSRLVSALAWTLVLLAAAGSRAADLSPFDRASRAVLVAQSVPELTAAIAALEGLADLPPADAALAKKLIARARLERGQLLYEGLVRLANENAAQHQPQISALARQAISDFETASQQNPKLAEAWLGFARIHALPGGDRARALAALDEALKLAPSADALRLRGSIRTQAGQLTEALADLDEARKLEPKHALTHEARALTLAALGKLDEAEQALDEAITLAPRAASPRLARARLNLARKNAERALADLNGLLALESSNVQALVMRAGLWEQTGKTDPLLVDLESLLKLQPQAMDVHRKRAGVLEKAGKLDGAIAAAERKLAGDTGLAPRLELGVLWMAKRDPAKAAQHFTSAVAADASSLAALSGRADALVAQKKYDLAAADYSRVIEKNPREINTLNNLAWILATSPDEKIRDGRRAVELATEACRLSDHKLPHLLSTLAAAHAERADFERAAEIAQKAVGLAQGEAKEQFAKELASYKANKPWRVDEK